MKSEGLKEKGCRERGSEKGKEGLNEKEKEEKNRRDVA